MKEADELASKLRTWASENSERACFVVYTDGEGVAAAVCGINGTIAETIASVMTGKANVAYYVLTAVGMYAENALETEVKAKLN